ncbi:hypothetical protein VPH35_051373 [Triticum aestivum]|uniref:uncharacterized protein n=1 Tax=Triticum aestivum TaxID=4565 RepID=UPI000845222B|nr:uncharacterized protein LOC123065306 [Triticum aestivum]
MDNAGLLAACLATVVAYLLAGHRLVGAADARWRHLRLIVPIGRRAKHVALAVALCLHAAVLLSSFTTSRDLAMHLHNTEAKLTRMEQIIQNQEKHNNEMMNSIASMLSNNSDDIKLLTYKLAKADGTPNSEFTVAVEDDLQPGETMDQEFPSISDGPEDAPIPDQQDEATEPHKPWRFIPVPEGHVFVPECVGDELIVHIRPSSQSDSEHGATVDADQQLPFTRGYPEAGTPSFYDGGPYRALFWSLPELDDQGPKNVLPLPWSRSEMWGRLTAAALDGTWAVNPPIIHEHALPESVTLSTDVVMFYRPDPEAGGTNVMIAAIEDVEHVYSMEEHGGPAVTALTPHSILPTYSGLP